MIEELLRRHDVGPPLVVAFELRLVERPPVARVAHEPPLRNQRVRRGDRLLVPAEVGERADLAKQGVDRVRLDLERPFVEGQRALEFLRR